MSLPEIIPSNLPIYVQNKNRSAFANSVIPSGAVLLFAESDGQGGSKLIAKNPDGSFTEVGGGGAGTFYKCASASNGTWTGYLASIDSTTGVWSFAETATSGLAYDRITPVVGSVYDADCTFEVKNYKTSIPTDYIFYLPLNADPGNTDETGKTLTFGNKSNITFGLSVQGITCARFTNTAVIGGPDFASIIPNDASAKFTASCLACVYQNDLVTSFGFNPEITYSTTYLSGVCMNQYNWRIYKGDGSSPFSSYSGTGFRHVLVTFGDNTCKMYVDGSFIGQGSYSVTDKPFGNNTVWRPYIGTANSGDSAYLAAFRVYDRVVTSDEIALLAAEFSPTPAS